MSPSGSRRLEALFRAVVAARWGIIALYALLLPLGAWLAAGVPSDNAIARLVVQDDAGYRENEAFQRIFPETESVVLLAVCDDPFEPGVLERVAAIEDSVRHVPRVQAISALDLHARAASAGGADFRRFATGTDMLRRQGLVGPDFLGIALDLAVVDAGERDETLAAIDRALAPFDASPAPLRRIGRIGGPYVDAWLEAETGRASMTYFPLFGLFVVGITLALYRSARTLGAFLITLAVCVSLSVGLARLVGFSFTIVSSLVPLTILVTATAALVYIQSRFAECPDGVGVGDHQVFTLSNKFVATTASIFAAAIGFAALSVSGIRPIREMGLWVAAGLAITWVVVFTLFPALQKVLATPTRGAPSPAGRRVEIVFAALPRFTHRHRWRLMAASALLMAAGALALNGLPGLIAPMGLETDSLAYVDRGLPLYEDMRRFERAISGLSALQVWVTSPPGGIMEPEVLRGLEAFSRSLEEDTRVGSVVGPTTLLRWASYMAGQGDRLPEDAASWPVLAAQLDGLLLQEPAARGFVDVGTLSNARLTVVYHGSGFESVDALRGFVGDRFARARATHPALSACEARPVGQGLLQARIAEHLVPTLTESFALTAAVIFLAFLAVFRSTSARLMAMIPSVFAILVMFLVMRVAAIPLNVATILIASTVLGATENDQIHFFYHYQERRDGTTETAMRHALRIAGRGILFATLINASGFLALALSSLPPMRQFGILTASAFALSMLASLTALPASLWIVSGESPAPAPASTSPAGS